MDPSCMMSLPNEILEQIWIADCLTSQDICRAASVCSKFHAISESDAVWKEKMAQRWPILVKQYRNGESYNWKSEFKHRFRVGQRVQKIITNMSAVNFTKEDVPHSGFCDFEWMIEEHPNASLFVIDALISIINDPEKHINLTEKYYAEKALRYINQLHMKTLWNEYLQLTPERQLLETGAIFIAQWFQPSLSSIKQDITDRLDEMALVVQRHLQEASPDHPACRLKQPPCSSELTESMWQSDECLKLLETLNYVFYKYYGFRGNEDDYYDPRNSYLNLVLERKRGIPITMAVIYIAIAARLGVVCHPVNFPSHFVLKWKEHPHLDGEQAYTFIDVFSEGRFYTADEWRQKASMLVANPAVPEYYYAAPNMRVIERMIRNLIMVGRRQGQMGDGLLCLRTALELNYVISPNDPEYCQMLAHVYLRLRINISEVLHMLQKLVGQNQMDSLSYLILHAQMTHDDVLTSPPEPVVAKRRADHPVVAWSVGMIMRHKRYHYYCVIYGWDERCEASDEWILQMGVNNLQNKAGQPFYNVLVEDGSNRYAAQESLEPASAIECKPITHYDVGKYFHAYHARYYEPNDEKSQQYPDDLAVTMQYAAQSDANNQRPELDS